MSVIEVTTFDLLPLFLTQLHDLISTPIYKSKNSGRLDVAPAAASSPGGIVQKPLAMFGQRNSCRGSCPPAKNPLAMAPGSPETRHARRGITTSVRCSSRQLPTKSGLAAGLGVALWNPLFGLEATAYYCPCQIGRNLVRARRTTERTSAEVAR